MCCFLYLCVIGQDCHVLQCTEKMYLVVGASYLLLSIFALAIPSFSIHF